ncbi:alpha-D-ribose 1-methylphosphonate 5-triphosphate diphosphatase [Psychromarinibacter sp. C21-152]|uniref:Alpha-D-ribose 1-methylphosphonate 5-triphosphate diphosphatase n=1 Tax=Psychromarinibacter sediminicola TaxID=3033385 RepID=A0AAE3NUB1_9RHOB|nr:alpha-D-ribose 1-methylphosphonate 5-triphosphate diphosphatase [Psychromarinibacter sediminicola]MDF0600722.1 alpha-D-ribose 1-methylphosphonate 5-triphosphate diphosphatase [Psychromarinibacter sediminicola]
MQAMVFEGAQVVLPDGIERVSVRVEDGRIVALDGPADGAQRIDARGRMLAPALVDIHGDAFERQLMPRPGVFVPTDVAILETDRQLAGNGIATAYHALTFSWEPGLRSTERGRELLRRLTALAPRLAAENRVQLRWETFCFEAQPVLAEALAGPLTPSMAFNDHTSMAMLAPEVPLQERPFDLAPDYPVTDLADPEFRRKMAARAERSNVSADAYMSLLERIWARRPQVAAAIEDVSRHARAAGAAMLSHDDSQPETRAFYRGHGARISEFPMNERVTRAAREAGDWIVFGAPNVLRGGSHIGAASPSAADMVERGLCDILASDYFYPAMLSAVARLHAERRAPLHALWKLVSANPAAASGLSDRGEIAVGRRADLVLLDWPDGAAPKPELTLRAGRVAHRTGGRAVAGGVSDR